MRPILVLVRSLRGHGGAERDTWKCIRKWHCQGRRIMVAGAFVDTDNLRKLAEMEIEWKQFLTIKRPVPLAQLALWNQMKRFESSWKQKHHQGISVCFDHIPVGDWLVGMSPSSLWWQAHKMAGKPSWRRPFLRLFQSWIDRAIVRADSKIITYSRAATIEYEKQGVHPARITRVIIPTDTRIFSPCIQTPLTKRNQILIIGSSPTHKGVDVALKAWPKVRKSFPHLKLILVCKPGSRAAKMAKNIEGVIISSMKKDPTEYYHRAKLVWAPSMFETWCNVVVESLACGVPVITTTTVPASEIIVDPTHGKVFKRTPSIKNDAYQLAELTKEVIASKDMLSESSMLARWHAVKSFQHAHSTLEEWAEKI